MNQQELLRRSPQRQWEYEINAITPTEHSKGLLNRMGAEGWELVAVNPLVFKRQLSDRPAKQTPLTENLCSVATHQGQSIQIFELLRDGVAVAHKWIAGNEPATAQNGVVHGDKEMALERAKSAIYEAMTVNNSEDSGNE